MRNYRLRTWLPILMKNERDTKTTWMPLPTTNPTPLTLFDSLTCCAAVHWNEFFNAEKWIPQRRLDNFQSRSAFFCYCSIPHPWIKCKWLGSLFNTKTCTAAVAYDSVYGLKLKTSSNGGKNESVPRIASIITSTRSQQQQQRKQRM